MGLAKENCFSIRGGGEENLILPYGKAFNKQKRRMKLFTRFALKRCALDAMW
jgi:hypothetical protein